MSGVVIYDPAVWLSAVYPATPALQVNRCHAATGVPRTFEQCLRGWSENVQLGGRGIRAMAAVEDGFLLLARFDAGPKNSFGVFFWDGADQLPGRDSVTAPVRLLAELPVGPGAPEGLAVLAEDEDGYRVLVLRDGVAGGAPRVFALPR